MRKRALAVVGLATLAVMRLVTANVTAQNQETQVPTFRTSVDAVQLTVLVTDASGNPVAGLTADDFEIYDGLQALPVVTFKAIDIPIEQSDPLQSDVDVLSNDRPPGRVYIIVFDDMSAWDAMRAKQFLREFIEKQFGPNDSAAVVLLTSGPSDSGQEFTSSPRRLLDAIDRFDGGQTFGNEWAREKNFSLDFRDLVKVLATMPVPRKALILVSNNIPLDADMLRRTRGNRIGRMFQDINMDFHEAVSLATRHSIAVYPITPSGLSSGITGEDPFDPPPGFTLPSFGPEPRPAASLTQRGNLQALADMTGGFALYNSNGYAAAFTRLVRENSTYYVLGFNAGDRRRNGQFAQLDVRVKRPGLTVRTLEGYLTPDERPRPVKRPKTVMAGAWDAVASPLTVSGVNLRLFAAPYRSSGKEATVTLSVEIATSHLSLVERDGAYRGQVDIVFAVTPAKGTKRYPIWRHRAELALKPDTYARVSQGAVRIISELPLPKGRYQIRAAAGAEMSGGSVVYDVEVPDFFENFSLSGIAVTSAQAQETLTATPHAQLAVNFPAAPTTAREFAQDDVLTLFAEAYVNRKKQHVVEFAVSLRDLAGREIETMNTERASPEKPTEATLHTFAPSLTLSEVPPGRYVLHVAAKSSLSGTPVKRIIPISVRAPLVASDAADEGATSTIATRSGR